MKRDIFTLGLDLGNELIIDNFAGGGGTSTGLEQAFGRPVDIAINHDPEALAMHAANHPHTKHLCESVWDVDPIAVTDNQPVGLVWLSPDCKHFSKAKGGKPVEKKIRGLAWVTLRWAAKCRPRVIMLENVEEFKTWGPLLIDADGNAKPDPAKKGKTFESFVRQLRAHGYDVDWRELRACDYGTPTIRKRFFLVARRDGIAIQFPEQSHMDPKKIPARGARLQPWRTAGDCIDFSVPCPSIFERNRPLADATLRRIAKGIMRYVINTATPFIVGQGGPIYSGKPVSVEQPFGTLTTENHRAVVVPSIVPVTHQGGDRVEAIDQPMRTVTGAHRGEKALMAATLVKQNFAVSPCQSLEAPLHTVTTQGNKFGVVSALLVDAAHGEVSPSGVKRWGPGYKSVEQPLGTVTASGGNQAMVSAFLAKHYTGVVGSDLEDPLGTVTACDHHSLVTAHVTKFRTGSVGSGMDEPLHTITAGPKENPAGAPHAMGMVSACLVGVGARAGQSRPRGIEEPTATITAKADTAIITSNLVKLRGTSSAAATDEPLGTVSAGGTHHAEVRAFLLAYYGTDQAPQLDGPLATITSHDRFGLVTIHGQDYQIVDIGLRMLTPRELYRAHGFPDSYVIGDDPSQGLSLTKSAQVRMCGNSVCPPMAKALIEANFAHERQFSGAAA